MKKLLSLFFVILMSFGLAVQNADAKRFGGGGNVGKQRATTSQQTATPPKPAQAPAAPAPAPAPSGASKWLGPLAGFAAGGLLASMFMGGGGGGGGMGGGMGGILMMLALGVGIFFIIRMMKKPQEQPRPVQYAGMGGQTFGGMNEPAMGNIGGGASPPALAASTRPAWFEDEPFLREGKKHFIRLQDDYDRGDLNDIREFVTPEMFAEVNMQIRERGDKPNKTEVVTLNAAMQEVVTEGDWVIASVRFDGMIREEIGAPAVPFNEIWHIQKSQSQPNATWLISGIQQV